MPSIQRTGVNFQEPWLLWPKVGAAANWNNVTSPGGAVVNVSTAAGFWTEMANRGVADNTNFTAATFKTTLTVSSGYGRVAGIVGPTASGAETTTFEVTVDGTLSTLAILCASGERAALVAAAAQADFAISNNQQYNSTADLIAAKTVGTLNTAITRMASWDTIAVYGTPCLIFRNSLLVRIKHSANVTGTGSQERQSGVMYMIGL